MASSKQSGDYTEEFICPVCLDLLNIPVILECGHNFCKTCIDHVWNSEEQPHCPVCRTEFLDRKYTVNRQLANMFHWIQTQGEKTKEPNPGQTDSNQLCKDHKERLKLFCENDECLVCSLCVPKHRGHNFLNVLEAVSIYKDIFLTARDSLESKLKELTELQTKQEYKISHIQATSQSLQHRITSKFIRLHEFLWDKEHQLIQQLKEEGKEILEKMDENLRKIKEMSEVIQKQISNIQLKLQEDYLLFLTGIKDETERIVKSQEEKTDVALVSQDLNLGVYQGPLQYTVWKEMLSILSPGLSHLTMDPVTAHPSLILSEDLTTVKHSDIRQKLPDNPERFFRCVSVLGSKEFSLGVHYWEMEVGSKSEWTVGIARESISRKENITLSPENGYWTVGLWNGNEYEAQDTPPKYLNLNVKPERIGIYLDYEGGQVSFYNADNMSHMYTFTATFTGRLYPYFCPHLSDKGKNVEPLKLFHLKL
ncbi:zinc-binding protein A33-like [Protopterus annectens]|uniref:zinc-binding protein A33-like n=1 Tax=Protopterus annectens TaxID=7888 RepID=UPI001CFAB01E|nr:zinc-binding protein A33-like [Protopterus annectens]